MPDDATQSAVSPPSLTRKHEVENPPAGWIAAAAALVPLMMAACLLAGWVLLAGWTHGRPVDPGIRFRGTIVAPGNEILARFPKPNLQVQPQDDLVALRARETAELGSYGWIDRKAGVVRIPIDRAMDLLAQRGLPTRATNQPAAVGPSEYELSKERQVQP